MYKLKNENTNQDSDCVAKDLWGGVPFGLKE